MSNLADSFKDTEKHFMQRALNMSLKAMFLAIFALGLVACANNTPAGNVTTTKSSQSNGKGGSGVTVEIPTPSQFCGTVTATEIGKIFGDMFPSPQSTRNGGPAEEIDCTTSGTESYLTVDYSYFTGLSCYNGQKASNYCLSGQKVAFNTAMTTDSQSGYDVQQINGIGDKAFCPTKTIAGVNTATLNVLKQWFMIQISGHTCAHDLTLAQDIVSKL
jgi:hypothetical protein